jgi:lambda repressor-like predicted transcriptional regulator
MTTKQGSGSSPVRLSDIPTSRLQSEIERRKAKALELARERDRLMARIAKIDAELREHGASITMGRRRRAGARQGTLAAALAQVLKGKEMGVTEAAEAVRKAGYKTNAENFRTIVNACLIRHTDMFRKVRRGLYTAT